MRDLNQFLETIDETFARMEYRGSRRDKDEDFRNAHTFSSNTNASYRTYVKEYATSVFEQYGVTDARFLKTRYAEEYIQRKIDLHHQLGLDGKPVLAASTVRQAINALTKYQHAVKAQNPGFRYRIIHTDKNLEKLKENHVIRHIHGPTTKKSNHITPQMGREIIKRISQLDSPQAHTLARVLEFQMETGSRISAALRLTVGDIRADSVRFEKDKGGKTRVTDRISPEYLQTLRAETSSMKSGRTVFEFRYEQGKRAGQMMGIESARHKIEREVQKIAKELGVQGANTHSFRKIYAKQLTRRYVQMTRSQLKREIKGVAQRTHQKTAIQRVKRQMQGNGHSYKVGQIIGKSRKGYPLSPSEQHMLAQYRKNAGTRDEGRTKNEKSSVKARKGHVKQAKLATSLQIGHHRVDVMQWYVREDDLTED